MRVLASTDTIRYYPSKVQGCKTWLIGHSQACLIMYNQTGCLLTQPCLPQRHILKGKIIILIGMMLWFAATATLSSPADKQALKQSALKTPLDCGGNCLYIAYSLFKGRSNIKT